MATRVNILRTPLQFNVGNTPYKVKYEITNGILPTGTVFDQNAGTMDFSGINVNTVASGDYFVEVTATEQNNPFTGRDGNSLARQGVVQFVLVVDELPTNRDAIKGGGQTIDIEASSQVN